MGVRLAELHCHIVPNLSHLISAGCLTLCSLPPCADSWLAKNILAALSSSYSSTKLPYKSNVSLHGIVRSRITSIDCHSSDGNFNTPKRTNSRYIFYRMCFNLPRK